MYRLITCAIIWLVSIAVVTAIDAKEPQTAQQLALSQVQNSNEAAERVRTYESAKAKIMVAVFAFPIIATLLMYRTDMVRLAKSARRTVLPASLLLVLCSVGCRPYDTPEFKEIGTNETAILVPLEGDSTAQVAFDSEEFLRENMIAAKRVQIPHRWVPLGRAWWDGEYIDTVRPITVDRSPETREWSADASSGTSDKNEAIWAESKDSVGFSTGITCTARIASHDDAVKFLFNYPALDEQNDTGLAKIMDREIRAKIQEKFSEFASHYDMDILREYKSEMMNYIRHGELPADEEGFKSLEPTIGVIEFFAERGIEITTIGQAGGFAYENPNNQKSIDAVFEAQQDEEVAKAEVQAQTERNKAIALAAEGKAEAMRLEAEGEADAIQTIADAKAYEIEKAQENWEEYVSLKRLELEDKKYDMWDGKWPLYYFGEDIGLTEGDAANILIQTPAIPDNQVAVSSQ